jgi:hypothetical protein
MEAATLSVKYVEYIPSSLASADKISIGCQQKRWADWGKDKKKTWLIVSYGPF